MERSKEFDVVERPKHYNSHPSGLEAIDICEHLSFNLGNAVKYLWRAGQKGDLIEDLEKALWYIKREYELLDLEGEIGTSDNTGRSPAMTKLIVRVLMRKVIASDPESLLAEIFNDSIVLNWVHMVEREIDIRKKERLKAP